MAKKKTKAKTELKAVPLSPLTMTGIGVAIVALIVIAFVIGRNAPPAGISQQVAQQAQQTAEGEESDFVLEPGNPVVAEVNGEEITRLDVFQFIQSLPEQTRRLPLAQLFPLAQQQVINSRIIANKTENVNLDRDKEVQRQLEEAKKQIVRNVFIENEISDRITEERLKGAYEQYKASFPEIQEVKASHILVEDKSLAKDIIDQLQEGADFAELAKEHSTDATAENGGELSYFSKNDVVPEFGEAAFTLEPGSYTEQPVKSEFGYHVIKVEDKRIRPPVAYEKAKPFLESQLRRAAMDEIMNDWRSHANVEVYDVNGKEIVPEGEDEEPVEEPAP